MKKLMFLIAVPLFVMACNGTQNVNPDELAEKAVELYEEAAPVVEKAAKELMELEVDVLIHNAGAYSIPRHKCKSGYDNVFQINFASPYYLTRRMMPYLRSKGGRVVAVGSIAHRYSNIRVRI